MTDFEYFLLQPVEVGGRGSEIWLDLRFRWLPANIKIYSLLVLKVKGTFSYFFSRFLPIFANKSHFTCHKPLKISYIPPDETLNIVYND